MVLCHQFSIVLYEILTNSDTPHHQGGDVNTGVAMLCGIPPKIQNESTSL
jgi:hypothetical protein